MPLQLLDYTAPADTIPAGGAKIAANFVELYARGTWIDTPTGVAATDQALVQTALNGRGRIFVPPGTFMLNATPIVYPNTILTGVPGLSIFKQAPGVNKLMLSNAALTAATTTVTIAWTAGVIATVTWTAHGFTTKDFVCFQGAAQLVYNMPHRVHEVIDANSFTIRCVYSPGAAGSGTIVGKQLDVNIHISDIIVDYDFANNASAVTQTDRHACLLAFLAQSTVKNFEARNVYKFGFNTCADINCRYENIRGNNVAEIFKHYGPSVSCDADGIYGSSVDDGTTIQALEPAAFIGYMPASGNIWNRTVRNVDVNSLSVAAGGVVVYASDNEQMEGLVIENVVAHTDEGNGVVLKYGDLFTTGKINTIKLGNINCSTGTATTRFAISLACNIDVLEMNFPRPKNQDLLTSMVKQESTSTIRSLIVNGLYYSNAGWSSGAAAYLWNLNGNVDCCIFNGGYLALSTSGRFMTIGSGVVKNVIFRGMMVNGASMFCIVQAGGGGGLRLVLEGCRLKNVAAGIDVRTLTKIVLIGNDFDTMSSGVVRPTTTAGLMAQIYGTGNTFTSAAAVAAANSATWESYTEDIAVDPITATNLATTNGQRITSTQAGIEGGPAVKTPAGWVALGTDTAGANKVIA